MFLTSEKIEDLLQKLKSNHWTAADLIDNYQKSVEDIGLEIEQHSSYKSLDQDGQQYLNIVNSMEGVFNDLNSLMPSILNLSEISSELIKAEHHQNAIIKDIKEIVESLNQKGINMDTLSMGMSSDYGPAIKEGSTIVRIGTGIFGLRK